MHTTLSEKISRERDLSAYPLGVLIVARIENLSPISLSLSLSLSRARALAAQGNNRNSPVRIVSQIIKFLLSRSASWLPPCFLHAAPASSVIWRRTAASHRSRERTEAIHRWILGAPCKYHAASAGIYYFAERNCAYRISILSRSAGRC